MILALAITSALGSGIGNAMIAIGVLNVPFFARLGPWLDAVGPRNDPAAKRRSAAAAAEKYSQTGAPWWKAHL